MNKTQAKKLFRDVADQTFVMSNPPLDDPSEERAEAVKNMCQTLLSRGARLDEVDEATWYDIMHDHGIPDDMLPVYMETIASWGASMSASDIVPAAALANPSQKKGDTFACPRKPPVRPGKLDAATRRKIPKHLFALPERRALPIHDEGHLQAAPGRLTQMLERGTVTKEEYKRAYANIQDAARCFGITLHTGPHVNPNPTSRKITVSSIKQALDKDSWRLAQSMTELLRTADVAPGVTVHEYSAPKLVKGVHKPTSKRHYDVLSYTGIEGRRWNRREVGTLKEAAQVVNQQAADAERAWHAEANPCGCEAPKRSRKRS